MGVLGARVLQAVRVPAGERVLELLPLLAEALSGAGPALLPLGEHDPRAAYIAEILGAGTGLGDGLGAGRGADLGDGLGAGLGDGADLGAGLGPGEDDAADPTALVMATSGSTGVPKGVLLSAGQLAASADATERRLGGPGSWLLTLPAYHIAGMQVLLRAARSGTEPVVMGGETPFSAGDFVRAARRLPGPRRYVSLVPTQMQRVMDDPAAAAATADIFDAVLVGGSAIPVPLLEAARRAGIPVVTTYGMSETCGGCVYDGIPLDGVRVSLMAIGAGVGAGAGAGVGAATRDGAGAWAGGEAGAGGGAGAGNAPGTGAIVLTGPMVARGYRGRPGDPAFTDRPGGWAVADGTVARGTVVTGRSFVTSDAGEITAKGELRVLGRLDDIIITGGVNVAPTAVEAGMRALPGVRDALVVSVPDAAWGQAVAALLVPDSGADWDLPRLRATLADRGSVPRTHLPQRLRVVAAIPQLTSGKPDRAAARALLS